MQKDFDNWNERKKNIQESSFAPYFHTREVWWCCLGINVGFEQDGSGKEYHRPILILKGISRNTFVGVPLTSSSHPHPFRPSVGKIEGKEARGLISQIRVLDTKRLVRKVGYLEKDIFEGIRKAVKEIL